MAIAQLTRFNIQAGGMEETLGYVSRARPIFERLGVEARFGIGHSGPYTGQLIVNLRYADWEAYGKATGASRADADYKALMSDIEKNPKVEMVDRGVIETIDA